jgi:phage terminase large subunit-like protein
MLATASLGRSPLEGGLARRLIGAREHVTRPLCRSDRRPTRRPLRRIAEINGQNHITALAFDRWRINDLKRELDAIGCYVPLEPHGQGYKDMSPAVDIVERLVIQRKLRHGAHPVLQWCAANAVVTRDPAGGRKFDKAKSTGRIDALVALAMALSLALLRAEKPIDVRALIG